jgi:hypothetical protein
VEDGSPLILTAINLHYGCQAAILNSRLRAFTNLHPPVVNIGVVQEASFRFRRVSQDAFTRVETMSLQVFISSSNYTEEVSKLFFKISTVAKL